SCRDSRLLAQVAEAPLLHVDVVGEARDERTLADLGIADVVDLLVREIVEAATYPVRNARSVPGIHEVVEMHLSEQQSPVCVDATQQPLPVELVTAAQDEVQDVGHVGAVSLGNEQAVP